MIAEQIKVEPIDEVEEQTCEIVEGIKEEESNNEIVKPKNVQQAKALIEKHRKYLHEDLREYTKTLAEIKNEYEFNKKVKVFSIKYNFVE